MKVSSIKVARIKIISKVNTKFDIDIKKAFFRLSIIQFSNFACTGKIYSAVQKKGIKSTEQLIIINLPIIPPTAIPMRRSRKRTAPIARINSQISYGWPVLGPEPFSGESLEPVPAEQLDGPWEIIDLDDSDNEQKISKIVYLDENSGYFNHFVAYRGWDFENQKKTICLAGFRESGIAFWGKVMYN